MQMQPVVVSGSFIDVLSMLYHPEPQMNIAAITCMQPSTLLYQGTDTWRLSIIVVAKQVQTSPVSPCGGPESSQAIILRFGVQHE